MSDIIVEFKPKGHKNLIEAIEKLQGAQRGQTSATKKQTAATKKATKSLTVFGTTTKRNAKAMNNLGLAFSTIRSKMLLFNFAMGLGVAQISKMAKESARLQDMSRAFTTLSGTGENSAVAVSKISSAVKGTMSQMDLFKQANNAMILGVTRNTDEMSEMFKIAQKLGAALGVDTAHAVESLITGIGRQSRLMLDNIGIIVKADEAYRKFADNLGITADKLTDAQKKQAFFTAAMESARTKAAELGDQQLTARDQFNQFNATIEDFTSFIGEKSTPVVLNFLNNMAESLRKIMETDLETSVRQLKNLGATIEEMAELQDLISFEKALDSINNFSQEAENLLKGTIVDTNNLQFEMLGVTEEVIHGARRTYSKISGFQNITTELILKAIGKERDERIQLKNDMTAASQDQDKAEQSRIAAEINMNLKNTNVLFKLLKLTKERDAANRLLFDSQKLVSEEISFEGETLEVLNEQTGESIGLTSEMVAIQDLLTQSYSKSLDGRLAIMESQIEFARGLELEGLLTEEQLKGLDALIAAYEKLSNAVSERSDNQDENQKKINAEIRANEQLLQSSFRLGQGYKNTGKAAEEAARAAVVAKIQEAVINYMAEAMTKIPFPLSLGVPALGAAMAAALGSVLGGSSSNGSNSGGGGGVYGSFEHGGYVGGRRHSQGGTIIEAERGEFVMSRNAVESIGLETLNQMNQTGGGGNINVSVTGNVLTQDFVEGELAESIKEAVRRGSDFGIG